MDYRIFIFSVLFFVSTLKYAYGCSCMPAHPQTHYCNSDFVILAKVKKEQIIESTQSRVYKVRVKREFKISEKGLVALKSGRLHTPIEDAACGAMLQLGKVYVISGRIHSLKAHITLCGMALPWNQVTRRQRKGLRQLYKQGCTCNIKYCMFGGLYGKCTRHRDSCNWNSHCETENGICLRQDNGSCMWSKNRLLAACRHPKRNSTIPGWHTNMIP